MDRKPAPEIPANMNPVFSIAGASRQNVLELRAARQAELKKAA